MGQLLAVLAADRDKVKAEYEYEGNNEQLKRAGLCATDLASEQPKVQVALKEAMRRLQAEHAALRQAQHTQTTMEKSRMGSWKRRGRCWTTSIVWACLLQWY